MLKSFLIALLAASFCLVLSSQAPAVPISLFQDIDTYLERSQDLVIAKCKILPKEGIHAFIDGLYPVEVEVLLSLKGERQPGPLKIATVYPLEVGKTYLLANTGGSALDTNFLSLAELSVVPLDANLEIKTLAGQSTKQQVQRIFAGYLHGIEQELKPLLQKQAALEKSLAGRTDDLFVHAGLVQLPPIKSSSTKSGQSQWLSLGDKRIEWSHASPGKSGYFYFGRPGGDVPQWEFSSTGLTDIKTLIERPLSARFYGRSSPGLEKALNWSGGNAIAVDVGQIILARTVDEPGKVYVIKVVEQDPNEAVTVEYAVISH
jgi:hypothetical protein